MEKEKKHGRVQRRYIQENYQNQASHVGPVKEL